MTAAPSSSGTMTPPRPRFPPSSPPSPPPSPSPSPSSSPNGDPSSSAAAVPALDATSAPIRHPVVVSATRDNPNPGVLRPFFCPFFPSPAWWSVKMYTSGRNLFSTPLDASTSRFPVCGETRSVNATPRTRFTNPSSHQSIATSDRAIGSFRLISPPAPGETPRFAIVIVSPSSTPKFLFSIGSVTVRNVSTLVSASSFVIPVRVKSSGFFANKQRHNTTSKKYPIPLELPQSCDIRRPPVTSPGLYFTLVPDSLITTSIPFVSLSTRRSSEAS